MIKLFKSLQSGLVNTVRETMAYLLLQTYNDRNVDQHKILSIYFHNPSKDLFEGVVKWLSRHGYQFISVKELECLIEQEEEKEKLAFISFDDGWKKNLDLIEIIERYQVPITIFIPTAPVEEGNYWWEYAEQEDQYQHTGIKEIEKFKQLPGPVFREKVNILKKRYKLKRSSVTIEDLRKLNANQWVTLGSHTVTHPILDQCSPERQAYELGQSKKMLSSWISEDVDHIAYPNGDFNEDSVALAKEQGYKMGFTVIPGRIDVKHVDPFRIPRNTIDDHRGYYENLCKVVGVWQFWKDKLLSRSRAGDKSLKKDRVLASCLPALIEQSMDILYSIL